MNQLAITVPTLPIGSKKNFKFINDVDFVLYPAVGGNLDNTNFPKIIESINIKIKLLNQSYVTEPRAYERILEALTRCLNACIIAENNDLASMILEKINMMKEDPKSYKLIIDSEFASKLRSDSTTFNTIATMNYVDQTVAESMNTGVAKRLPSYGDKISELPSTPDDKALRLLGITCLTTQCFNVILKLIGFANKQTLAKLIVNLQNIAIMRSQWRSYKTLVTYYYSQFKAMKMICFLAPDSVPNNTAEALEETFLTSLIEALMATPITNDISKLPFDHNDTHFVVNMEKFMEKYAGQSLSTIMPLFIALLENLELVSKAPKENTFNTPRERRTHRTPAMSGGGHETGPAARSKEIPRDHQKKSATRLNTDFKFPRKRSNNSFQGYDEKVKNCTSCGGSRDPKAVNTCVKNITNEQHCPLKTEYFDKLHFSGGRHPSSGDDLNPKHGYVCHLCGCGGHGHKYCPYEELA